MQFVRSSLLISPNYHLPRCEPVYVQYEFPTQPPFRTPALPHASTLAFNSTNVILLGTIGQNLLLEHLRGPPLTIQVHDRDTKQELLSSSDALFGIESQDNLIGTHAFGADLARLASGIRIGRPDPHGVATFDLSLLLSGQMSMEFTLPVVCGPRPPPAIATSIAAGPSSATAGTGRGGSYVSSPLRSAKGERRILPGDYLDSGCEITIKLELTYPLALLSVPETLPLPTEKMPQGKSKWKQNVRKLSEEPTLFLPAPFNRMVYVVSAYGEGGGAGGGGGGEGLVDRLLAMVNRINAKTLDLGHHSPKVLQAALSTYKLSQ